MKRAKTEKKNKKTNKKEMRDRVENIELSSVSSHSLHRENLCKVHCSERGESLLSRVCFNHFSLRRLRSSGLLKAVDKI